MQCGLCSERALMSLSSEHLSLHLQAYVNLLFWYQFFCGFSGTSMTNCWVLIFFNLLFTSVPPIIYGVLEKDVSAETLLQLPELYQSGQHSEVSVQQKRVSRCTAWRKLARFQSTRPTQCRIIRTIQHAQFQYSMMVVLNLPDVRTLLYTQFVMLW